MKIFAALLLFPVLVFGQATTGFHRVNQVIARGPQGTTAQVVPNATVYVTNTVTGLPAVIYSDPLLTVEIPTGIVSGDQNGNYGYYIPLNYCVNETVSSPGSGQFTTSNVCANAGTGTPGGTEYAIQFNNGGGGFGGGSGLTTDGLGDLTVAGAVVAQYVNKVVNAASEPGTTADVQIVNAIAALPSTGGTLDLRGFGATTVALAATVTLSTFAKPITVYADPATLWVPPSATASAFYLGDQLRLVGGLTVDTRSYPTYSGNAIQNDKTQAISKWNVDNLTAYLGPSSTGHCLALISNSASTGIAFPNIYGASCYGGWVPGQSGTVVGANTASFYIAASNGGYVNSGHFHNMIAWYSQTGIQMYLNGSLASGTAINGNEFYGLEYEAGGLWSSGGGKGISLSRNHGTTGTLEYNQFFTNTYDLSTGYGVWIDNADAGNACWNLFQGFLNNTQDATGCGASPNTFNNLYPGVPGLARYNVWTNENRFQSQVQIENGNSIVGFSDAGSTQTYYIDAANGYGYFVEAVASKVSVSDVDATCTELLQGGLHSDPSVYLSMVGTGCTLYLQNNGHTVTLDSSGDWIVPGNYQNSNAVVIPSTVKGAAGNATGYVELGLTGTTGSIGGSALTAGTCTSGTATISGGTAGHPALASESDGTFIGGNYTVRAVTTNSTTVTVEVCAAVAGTPAAKTYNVVTF